MPNRTFQWITTLRQHQALASGGQTNFNLSSDLAAGDRRGATLTRMLLNIHLRNDTVNVTKVLDYGVVWINADAATAGAFPDPISESEQADWLLRDRMVISSGPNTFEGGHLTTQRHDNRSQRICRAETDQLHMVMDLDSVFAGGVFITFICRILVLKP